ncbi:MAG: hypothetical protein J7599_12425 [Niabella sp.]|nr:hypothetical protein [Niabella sp.]
MRKLIATAILLFFGFGGNAQTGDLYETSVVFPAGYQVGDYIEFVKVAPLASGSSGYYEISISYTRGNMAASATHIASISHANPAVWREAGRVNANNYISIGSYNFTVDCNTEPANPRFRIRAVATYGLATDLTVYIRIRSVNRNAGWTVLNQTGNDVSVTKLLPMTNDWTLLTGNPFSNTSAQVAIKATVNGNVGIGTASPTEKLSVNGKIRAQELKIEAAPWPDYVFLPSYRLMPLNEIASFIKKNGHLPEVPSAKEVSEQGIAVGASQAVLLKKIEELTLHLIRMEKQLLIQEKKIDDQAKTIRTLSVKQNKR